MREPISLPRLADYTTEWILGPMGVFRYLSVETSHNEACGDLGGTAPDRELEVRNLYLFYRRATVCQKLSIIQILLSHVWA